MPSVNIVRKTSYNAEDSFQIVAEVLSTDPDLKKLDPKFKFELDPETRTGEAEGTLFKAKVRVADHGNDGSTIELSVEFPITMMAFKGMIERSLQKKIDEALP